MSGKTAFLLTTFVSCAVLGAWYHTVEQNANRNRFHVEQTANSNKNVEQFMEDNGIVSGKLYDGATMTTELHGTIQVKAGIMKDIDNVYHLVYSYGSYADYDETDFIIGNNYLLVNDVSISFNQAIAFDKATAVATAVKTFMRDNGLQDNIINYSATMSTKLNGTNPIKVGKPIKAGFYKDDNNVYHLMYEDDDFTYNRTDFVIRKNYLLVDDNKLIAFSKTSVSDAKFINSEIKEFEKFIADKQLIEHQFYDAFMYDDDGIIKIIFEIYRDGFENFKIHYFSLRNYFGKGKEFFADINTMTMYNDDIIVTDDNHYICFDFKILNAEVLKIIRGRKT